MGTVLRIVEVRMGQVVLDRNVDKGFRAVASDYRTTKEKKKESTLPIFSSSSINLNQIFDVGELDDRWG